MDENGEDTNDEATGDGESSRNGDITDEPQSETPLDDLVTEAREQQALSDGYDELFEYQEVALGEIDTEELWEQVEAVDKDTFERDDSREIRELSKQKYCHRCEYFEEPPTVACTHEGTEILELTTLGTFRVADCPKIREDEALEGER